MKSRIKISILIILLAIFIQPLTQKVNAQPAAVSFQVFYDQLSPYGRWINHPSHGYMWVPSVSRGFRPYFTNGRWVISDYGWTWVSSYNWGWAPFHYGRWFADPVYGWSWVPDYEWGPGWVSWRRANGYYGWAPMGPGVSLSIAMGSGYMVPENEWIFVQDRHLGSSHFNNYLLAGVSFGLIFRSSTLIVGTHHDERYHSTYFYGPERGEFQRITGRPVRTVVIHENDRPGQRYSKNDLWIYRPNISREHREGIKYAPTKSVDYNVMKSRNPRSTTRTSVGQQSQSQSHSSFGQPKSYQKAPESRNRGRGHEESPKNERSSQRGGRK